MARERALRGAPREFSAEVQRLKQRAASQLSDPSGKGVERVDLAIRTSMVKRGGGCWSACSGCHLGQFSEYRSGTIDTVDGPVRLHRAYYPECGHGRLPRDEEPGVAGDSLSPGLRRMVDRVGSQ